MADDTDKDIKYVLGGVRHDGTKGRKFTLWSEGFLDAATGLGDDDYSMEQVFRGTDGPQGGLGAAPARRQAKRRREAYAALMKALDKDSCRDLMVDIRTNARGNGRAAWVILTRECGETVSSLDDGIKIRESGGG